MGYRERVPSLPDRWAETSALLHDSKLRNFPRTGDLFPADDQPAAETLLQQSMRDRDVRRDIRRRVSAWWSTLTFACMELKGFDCRHHLLLPLQRVIKFSAGNLLRARNSLGGTQLLDGRFSA
jgi:hypothetical protein